MAPLTLGQIARWETQKPWKERGEKHPKSRGQIIGKRHFRETLLTRSNIQGWEGKLGTKRRLQGPGQHLGLLGSIEKLKRGGGGGKTFGTT